MPACQPCSHTLEHNTYTHTLIIFEHILTPTVKLGEVALDHTKHMPEETVQKARHTKMNKTALNVGWSMIGGWDVGHLQGRDKLDMWLAITPEPTVYWLFRTHDLPSKYRSIQYSSVAHVLHV